MEISFLRVLSAVHKPVLLRGLMDKEGAERDFNPLCTAFQNGLARSPLPLEGPVAQGRDV